MDDLQMDCFAHSMQMLVCWSTDEAAQYLRSLKAYENSTKSILEGKPPKKA